MSNSHNKKIYFLSDFHLGAPDHARSLEREKIIVEFLDEIKNAVEFDKAMQTLDEYEGSYDQPGEPALFRRELIDVHLDNEIVKAWIYWYNRPVAGMKWIASGDILKSDF